MQEKHFEEKCNDKLPPLNDFLFNTSVDYERTLCFGNNAFSKSFPLMLFKTREKLYLRFLLVFFLASFFGVCIFFFANIDKQVIYNEVHAAVLRNSSAISFNAFFKQFYPTFITVLILFISGLTVFARFVSYAYVTVFFIKWGLKIKAYFDILSTSSSSLTNYIFISGLRALILILFVAEICKFSDISVKDIQKTIRPANILPYFIVCLIYLLLEMLLTVWYMSTVN